MSRMPKTRKQRGGVAKAPKHFTYSQRRALERKRPIGYELPRREPLMNWVKPVRPGREPNTNAKMIMAVNKAITQLTKRKKVPRKLNLTLNIRRNNSTTQYINSVKTLLHKINEILREPNEDYDLALEISDQLKNQLIVLEDSLGESRTKISKTSYNKIIERVIHLIEKHKSPEERILIAVTVDEAITNAKAKIATEADAAAVAGAAAANAVAGAPAPAGVNANVDKLAKMLDDLKPFGRA